jgi:predicted nucleic acid-binding protein
VSSAFWADTSFLYALFVEADANHRAAGQLWKHCVANRVRPVTSGLVTAELGTLLAYRFGHEIAYSRMAMLCESELLVRVHADDRLEAAAIRWWRRFSDQHFSFADCVSFEFMRQLGIRRAISFDLDFAIAGYETVRDVGQVG